MENKHRNPWNKEKQNREIAYNLHNSDREIKET